MQIQAQPQEYDAIVVGSGASGGWAAKRMSEAGMRVALVCAGRPLKDGDYREHVQPYELKYQARANDLIRRTRPVQKDCYACTEYNADWFCNDIDEPYTTAKGKPFSWQGRMRVTGGRTNVWGRHSYRFSQQDLKGYSFDGAGADWPLDYKDLVPYYELVEDYVGISGMVENIPELPDSKFQPSMPLTCVEDKVRGAIKTKFGRTLTMGRARQPHQADQRPRAPATTAAPASAAASRTPTSTPPSPPSPTRSRPASARTSRTPWSTRC